MKMWTTVFLVISVLALIQPSQAVAICGGNYNTSEPTPFNLTFSDTTNTTCIWVIQRINNTQTNVDLTIHILNSNSSLTIYSGQFDPKSKKTSNAIKTYSAGDSVTDLVISTHKMTTIVYKAVAGVTKGSMSVKYDANPCAREVAWGKAIVSPVYLAGTGSLTCKYNLAIPADKQLHVMSFTDFNLPAGILTVKHGAMNQTFKGSTIPDDIVMKEQANVSVTVQINNSTTKQYCHAFMSSDDPDCSKVITINGTGTYQFSLSSTPNLPLNCRLLVTSASKTTVIAMAQSIVLLGGGNSIIVRDGRSQSSVVVANLGRQTTDYGQYILSSGNNMLVQIRLVPSLSKSIVNMVFNQQGGGAGRYSGVVGNLTLNATKLLPNSTVFFQVTAPAGKAQVTLTAGLMTKAVVQVYDDDTATKQLAEFRNVSDFYTVTGSGDHLLIKASNFSGHQKFSGHYRPAAPDCDQLSTGMFGTYDLKGNKGGRVCTWSILAQSRVGSVIKAPALIALTLGSMSLCKKDTVTVYEGLTTAPSTPIAVVTMSTQNTPIPMIYAQNQNGLRLVLSNPKNSCPNNSFSQVHASYQTYQSECGVSLIATSGTVLSPQSPDQYPLHAHCKWHFTPGKKSTILLSVDSLHLNPNHTLSLDDMKKQTSLANYMNMDLIVPVTNKSNYYLDFNSIGKQSSSPGVTGTGSGFSVSYQFLDCGGMLTKSSYTIHEGPSPKNSSRACVWVVKIPAVDKNNLTNILSVNVTITGQAKQDVVQLYDGGTIRAKVMRLNMTKGHASVLTTRNTLLVSYSHAAQTSNSTFDVKVTYTTYVCPKTDHCQNGICIHADWYCNGINDCGDNTDELHCPLPITTPAPPTPTPKKGVKSYVVAIVSIVCFALGIGIAIAVPALYKRVRYPNYSHLQDMGVTT